MGDFIGYGRISRVGDRAERLRSDKDQNAEIRAAGRARGLTVSRVEFDYDESGARADRPRLMAAIEAIEAGEAEGIIVARLDRFTRDSRHVWELAERIHTAGGRIISYAENADFTTPDGELQVGLITTFARYQRRILAEAFKKAKRGAVENGVPVTTRLGPGLRLVYDERGERRIGVEHDLPAADVIADVFAMRVAGAGPAAIGDYLTARGVKTSMGSAAWSKQAVYGLLRNRAYLGELHNGEFVNRNAWAPIVDEATFLAAQRPLRAVATRTRIRESVDLLPGLARCASCRYSMSASARSGRNYRWYRCMGHHAGGKCPGPARLRADLLEPIVLSAFWQLVRAHHARPTVADDAAVIDELRRVADRARRRFEMYRDDPDLDETVDAMGGMVEWREGLRVHRERADVTATDLAHALAQREGPSVPVERDLRADWGDMPRDVKRTHLFALIDCVAVLPASCGLAPERRVVVFAAGHGPRDLPRRGFRERAFLAPFELPAGAGVLGLQPVDVGGGEVAVSGV